MWMYGGYPLGYLFSGAPIMSQRTLFQSSTLSRQEKYLDDTGSRSAEAPDKENPRSQSKMHCCCLCIWILHPTSSEDFLFQGLRRREAWTRQSAFLLDGFAPRTESILRRREWTCPEKEMSERITKKKMEKSLRWWYFYQYSYPIVWWHLGRGFPNKCWVSLECSLKWSLEHGGRRGLDSYLH